MDHKRIIGLATAIVAGTGLLWGLYWLPVRALNDLGLTGAWGTLAITGSAALLLLPLALMRRDKLRGADPWVLLAIAVGGGGFALYSIGFIYGRVAIIILLFFLTPVWSTLIARYVMGWHTPVLRIVAIAVGLMGLGVMLSAGGQVPVPRGLGEWMALLAGLLWAVSTTTIRARSSLDPLDAAVVFVTGAAITSAVLAPLLEPLPPMGSDDLRQAVLIAAATGALWWGLSIGLLMWATLRLDPTRVGILLMTEVLIGIASAAYIAGETLSGVELAGGALVVLAGVLEVWPVRGRAREGTET